MKLFVIDYIKFMFSNTDGSGSYKLFCIHDTDASYTKCSVFMIHIVQLLFQPNFSLFNLIVKYDLFLKLTILRFLNCFNLLSVYDVLQ